MQDQQEQLDEVVDVFQDAQAISDEINYQQDQINDIINQNTDQITGEGCSAWLDVTFVGRVSIKNTGILFFARESLEKRLISNLDLMSK